jgi:hypothetical protein
MTIRRLITANVLPAIQPPYAQWAIRREDLALGPVRQAAEAADIAKGGFMSLPRETSLPR